jgi:hypothetical protein
MKRVTLLTLMVTSLMALLGLAGCLVPLRPGTPSPDATARLATAVAVIQTATTQAGPIRTPDNPSHPATVTAEVRRMIEDTPSQLPVSTATPPRPAGTPLSSPGPDTPRPALASPRPSLTAPSAEAKPTYPPDWVFSPSGRNWRIQVDAVSRAQTASRYSPVSRAGVETAPGDRTYLLVAARLTNDGKYPDNSLHLTDIVISDDGDHRYPLQFIAAPVAVKAGTGFWYTDGLLSAIKLAGDSLLEAQFVFLVPKSADGLKLSLLNLPPIDLLSSPSMRAEDATAVTVLPTPTLPPGKATGSPLSPSAPAMRSTITITSSVRTMSASAQTLTPIPDSRLAATPSVTPSSLRVAGWEDLTANSVCLTVEQTYPQLKENFALPIAERIQGILGLVGVQVARDASCQATLTVEVTGTVLSLNYSGFGGDQPIRTCYTGADLDGHIRLAATGREPQVLPFSARLPAPLQIASCYDSPEGEQFHRAIDPGGDLFDDIWLRALLDSLSQIWGLPILTNALHDADMQLVDAAAEVLGDRGRPEAQDAVPVLVRVLENPAGRGKCSVAGALSKIGPEPGVIPALAGMLSDTDWGLRYCGAYYLKLMGPAATNAVPALIQTLTRVGEDTSVRYAVIEALGAVGPAARPAIPELIQALSDSNSNVKTGAHDALKVITEQDFGEDAAQWQQWWEQQR